MSDGKNIELKIVATGGDAAAAELARPKAAIDSLIVSEEGLAQKRAQFLTAAQAEVAEVDRMVQSTKKLNEVKTTMAENLKKVQFAADNLSGGGSGQGLQKLRNETDKITAKGVQMGTGFSNVGFQLQDFAVQVGAGTGAMRAFSQQAPQLLSGFGPLGIALGTVAAVGAPLVGILLDQAKATQGITVATEEATRATVDMQRDQALSLKMEAESVQRKRELTEQLRQITSEQYSYNDSLQEQLDLLAETQSAENELAAARGQLEVDKAEGDPVRQEEIRNRVRKEAQARELQQIEERRRAASELVDRKTNQETEVGTRGQEAATALRGQAEGVGAEALQAEQLADLKKASADDKAEAAGKLKGPRKAILDREVAKLREEARKATDEAKSLRAQETDLKSQADTVDSTTKAEVEKLQAEANKLFDEVRKLARDAEKKKGLFAIRDEQGDLREGSVRKQDAGREAKENFKDYQDFRQGRSKEEAERRKDAGAAGRAGRSAEGLVPDNAPAAARKKIEEISDGLQDGDQGGEMERLLAVVEQLAKFVKTKGDGKGNGRDLSRRIEILEQQIRSK